MEKPTPGERAVNWAKAFSYAVPSLLAIVVACAGYVKSCGAQDDVDEQWKKLEMRVMAQEKIINQQTTALEKNTRRMIAIQHGQVSFNVGKIYEQNEHLLAKIDSMMKKRPLLKQLSKPAPKPRTRPKLSPMQQSIPKIPIKPFKR